MVCPFLLAQYLRLGPLPGSGSWCQEAPLNPLPVLDTQALILPPAQRAAAPFPVL